MVVVAVAVIVIIVVSALMMTKNDRVQYEEEIKRYLFMMCLVINCSQWFSTTYTKLVVLETNE